MTDQTLWIHAGPSRRLRKLYAQLATIEHQITAARRSNPCPDHAPTACRLMRATLRPLTAERDRALERIGRLSGDDDDSPRERRRGRPGGRTNDEPGHPHE